MMTLTRDPQKVKESEEIARKTEEFLKGKKLKTHPIHSNTKDIPSDEFTLMKKSAETHRSRIRPTKFNRGKL